MAWKKYLYTPQVNRRGSVNFTYRPLVKIEVSGEYSTEKFMGLVDSGTDITMMDSEIAELLGIDRKVCKKATASGVGGEKQGFVGRVRIVVDGFDITLTATVLFVDDLSMDVILGQDDFFRRFHVRFERDEKFFYLKLA